MPALIDLKDNKFVAVVSLPHKMVLPDGGMALFEQVGQSEPAHAPRYKVVETREATTVPDYPVKETGVSRSRDGETVVLRRTYVPDQLAFERAIEAHVNAVAGERGYSSAVSLASYVASTVALWKAEAEAFIAWRDAVWTYALAELDKAKAATRDVPSLAALVAELPVIAWPEAK